MTNIKYHIEGKKLVIIMDTSRYWGGVSKSGKSSVVASTNGAMVIPGTDVMLSLNCYRKKYVPPVAITPNDGNGFGWKREATI